MSPMPCTSENGPLHRLEQTIGGGPCIEVLLKMSSAMTGGVSSDLRWRAVRAAAETAAAERAGT